MRFRNREVIALLSKPEEDIPPVFPVVIWVFSSLFLLEYIAAVE